LIDKVVTSISAALDGIGSGSTVLVGGFGAVGQPDVRIEGLAETGGRALTVVANNAGSGYCGLARLLELGCVQRIICSYPRGAGSVVCEQLYRDSLIQLEIVPQGTLVERLRAAGAGIPAFYTATSVGTLLAEGKSTSEFEGHTFLLERALRGDVALVRAHRADRWGDLTYRRTGRNFNPVMATAARLTVAQVDEIVDLGSIDPEAIVTPGIYVDRVIRVDSLAEAA